MIDFEKDADALKLQDDDIQGISNLAKKLKKSLQRSLTSRRY